MTRTILVRTWGALLALGSVGLFATAAEAAEASAGDSAWVLFSTALVLLMALPGLALFYGGLVRSKNTISILMQVMISVCLVSLIWVAYGYSVTFTGGTWASFFGGFKKAFLSGVGINSLSPTHANGIAIPEYAFVAFQMMFACITPAILIGAFAERVRFPAIVMFIAMWVTFVYLPIAHMTWFGPAPDAIGDAARALALAATDEARRQAEAILVQVQADAGLFRQWGTIDFAGGLVVHINAGIAGLVGAIVIGRRAGYGRVSMAPHNLGFTMIGAALLWVGWIGLNAGSALRADGTAALAVMNTFVAATAGALAWVVLESFERNKPSLLGLVSGALAGLVAVTPAAGYAGPMGAIVLGLAAGPACYWCCTALKARYQYDDSLDVFGIHCIAGVLGTLAVALLANPLLGGTGIVDFAISPGQGVVAAYATDSQLWAQLRAVLVTLAWSGYATARILAFIDQMIGLRAPESDETQGLDATDHGERVYN